MFGNGSAKTWTLIANHFDPTLIKNYLAYSVCNEFASQPYTTSLEFVDLYLNNEYQGVYAVCEQIEAHKNRVNSKTSWGEPQDMNYLIELDNRLRLEHETGLNICSSESNYYKIHYPDVEDTEYTQDFTDYVKNYFQDCYTAVNGKDWATISNLVDIESCADTYIMHEFFKNSDAGFSSFYMYIHHVSGEPKLTFGPLWDFDLTADFNNNVWCSWI